MGRTEKKLIYVLHRMIIEKVKKAVSLRINWYLKWIWLGTQMDFGLNNESKFTFILGAGGRCCEAEHQVLRQVHAVACPKRLYHMGCPKNVVALY